MTTPDAAAHMTRVVEQTVHAHHELIAGLPSGEAAHLHEHLVSWLSKQHPQSLAVVIGLPSLQLIVGRMLADPVTRDDPAYGDCRRAHQLLVDWVRIYVAACGHLGGGRS